MAIIIWTVVALCSFVSGDRARVKAASRVGEWLEAVWVVILVAAFFGGAVALSRAYVATIEQSEQR